MSTWAQGTITCPRCAGPVDARQARSVSATRAPAWRDALLAGELHRPRCATCGATIDVQVSFLYTDLPRGQWLFVESPGELARWAEKEREALTTFDRVAASATASGAGDMVARCRVRVVFGVDELRERVAADTAGLDDGELECVKLAAVRRQAELRGAGERLRFDRFREDELELVSASAAAPAQVRGRWRIPRAEVKAVRDGIAEWRERFPELFGRGFVSIDRWLVG